MPRRKSRSWGTVLEVHMTMEYHSVSLPLAMLQFNSVDRYFSNRDIPMNRSICQSTEMC